MTGIIEPSIKILIPIEKLSNIIYVHIKSIVLFVRNHRIELYARDQKDK